MLRSNDRLIVIIRVRAELGVKGSTSYQDAEQTR